MLHMNAGHNEMLHLMGDKVRGVLSPGNPLGFSQEATYKVKQIQIAQGDTLVFYTDGLLENEGPDGKTLKSRQLRSSLNHGRSAIENKNAVMDAADAVWMGNKGEDDCTLFILKWQNREDSSSAA